MRRTPLLLLAIFVGGAIAAGCAGTSSSSSSASTTTTAAAKTFTGSAYSWLATKAEVWNHALNLDQNAVAEAGAEATSEANASQYFERLATACNALLTDSGRALDIPHAPTPTLDSAWRGMLAQTRNYASDCLALTRTGSNADFTRWNESLSSMNSANAVFNQVVNAVRAAQS